MTQEKEELELDEIFHIRKEIQDLEERTDKIEKKSTEVADTVQKGYKQRAIIYGVDVKRAYKLQCNYEKLKKFKIQLVDKEKEIEDYIEKIPYSEIRQIFRYRYLDGLNWIQVAHRMNRNYNNKEYTEGSVRLKHDRFLEKN